MSFDPNNYDIFDDNTNTAQDYESVVGNTKGGTVNQIIRKKSGTNHDFEFVDADKDLVGLGQVDNTSDLSKPISTATQTALDLKVDKVADKGLSTNDYDNTEQSNVASNTTHRGLTDNPHAVTKEQTGLGNVPNVDTTSTENINDFNDKRFMTESERTKLGSLEDSKFLGEYPSLLSLETAHPSPVDGSYANVDTGIGEDVARYLWDSNDDKYVLQLGESTQLTDAQIKTQYENNANTNGLTDTNLQNIIDNTTHKNSDGKQHSDVVLNNTHRAVVTGNPHNVVKSDVGLSNVDNTSDADKPVSTATQTALNGKVNTATCVQSADSSVLQVVGVTQAIYDGLGSGRPVATLYIITDAV